MLKRLLYASRRKPETDDAAIDRILSVSQRNNARDGITGLLMHDEKRFIQFLEGDHDAVARCYVRIAMSPRHEALQIAAFDDSALRLFSEWDMHHLPDPRGVPSLSTLWRRLMAQPEDARLADFETALFRIVPM